MLNNFAECVLAAAAVCYTAPMFIHRISVTGLSDRGAWPWRHCPVFV